MLNDPVLDPALALDNLKVAERHANAYLLQRWAHEATENVRAWEQPQLFEVLGTLSSFLNPRMSLNLLALERWASTQDPSVFEDAARCAGALLANEDTKRALRDGLPSTLLGRVRNVVTAMSAVRATRSGADVVRHLLALTKYQIRPLLDAMKPTYETSWFELKADRKSTRLGSS